MAREIKCIFQDCLNCGDLAIWYAANTEYATKHKMTIVPVHYSTPQAEGEMARAAKSGIKSYPFFTDGDRYAKNIEDLVVKLEVEKKPARKSKKVRTDGPNAEIK